MRLKFITFFLAKTETKDVKISFEHKGFAWLPFEQAIERLSYDKSKKLLKKANLFLKTKKN